MIDNLAFYLYIALMRKKLDIRKFLEHFELDLWQSNAWSVPPINRTDVLRAISSGEWRQGFLPSDSLSDDQADWEYHVRRVAYLVKVHSTEPIEIDVGVPSLNYVPPWPILDGNHRLMAALYLNKPSIDFEGSGCVDLLESFTLNSHTRNADSLSTELLDTNKKAKGRKKQCG